MSSENMQNFRRQALGLLARAPAARLAQLMPADPAHEVLRAPEIGTVMLRGRAGGTGAAFNLGEIVVTRASIRLADSGTVGHGYVQGRDRVAGGVLLWKSGFGGWLFLAGLMVAACNPHARA